MRDYVYIFENEWMPCLIKIGITDNLKARVSNSGNYTYVPCHFKCVCAIKAEGRAKDIENFIKEQYAEFKIGYREFYKMSVDKAKSLLKSMAKLCNGELVSQQEIDDANSEADEGDDGKHKRQRNRTFATLGIPIGSELTFIKNDKNEYTNSLIMWQVEHRRTTRRLAGKPLPHSATSCFSSFILSIVYLLFYSR